MSTVPDSATLLESSSATPDEINELNARAWALRLSDAAEGLRLAQRAAAAARVASDAHGEALALRSAGACRCMLEDYDAALVELEAARRLFEGLGDRSGKATSLNWIGKVHLRRADLRLSLRMHLDALRLQRGIGDREGEGESLKLLGDVYFQMGDLAGALEHFQTALQVEEERGDELEISHAVNNVGNVHGELGDYARALEYHTRAAALKQRLGDDRGYAIALANVGRTHKIQADHGPALDCFKQALAVARKLGDRSIEARVLHEIADLYLVSGNPVAALGFFLESVEVARASDRRYTEVDSRIGIGKALVALCRAGEAAGELEQALALAQRIDSQWLIYEAHLALSAAYEAQGDTAKALEHFREYHCVKDEVFSAKSERRIQAVLVKAEVERSEREAELLRTKNDELSAANEEKARLLEVLRRQAEELERLSREDALTGLFNRRHVDAALALEWERARRFGRDLTVAMADIDHFKAVNDRFSHAVGDEVLRRVAEILRAGTRAVDVVGRWGGEEFVLLLVETPPKRAAGLCEKLRAAVEAHDWSAVAPGLAVTLSLGVAGSGEAADPAALLAAADARLYQAKRAGRNRVVSPG